MAEELSAFEARVLDAIRHHIEGWRAKIARDFSKEAYDTELGALHNDPVYQRFGLDSPEYVLVRLIGRMSISVGRRLGEIYDKMPRFVAAARFRLTPDQVAEVFDGLELDIALRKKIMSKADAAFITDFVQKIDGGEYDGLGIEIRYNFNPNDSARLRKDVDVVNKLKAHGLLPIYLIFSAISPRDEAIARLTRAGWIFKQGEEALGFMTALLGTDVMSVLDNPTLSVEIKRHMRQLMKAIFKSEAMRALTKG
jgi:hypothetical protein